jgi:uncharacterized protein YbjT (DUF2867 family)
MSRIITVFGATGTQGSSVVDAILADGTFVPRAVTRDPSSQSAQQLKARGAQVVEADLWKVESLTKAIEGSEAVFGVTNFWDPSVFPNNPKGEIEQGKNLVEACKAAGVKFLVFSSLPNASKLSNGKYTKILHYDHKAIVEDYIRESGVPHAILHTGWFAENIWSFGSLVKKDDGSYELVVPRFSPTAKQAITWVKADLGQSALALFKNYTKPGILGHVFHAVTAQMSYAELAELLEKALGKPVKFVSPPTAGMEELDEMYAYQSEFGTYRDSEIPDPRLIALGVKFSTIQEFIDQEVKKRFA